MVIRGHFENGVIIPEEPITLPEGTKVQIEVVGPKAQKMKRQGGMWKGRVVIADDFDTLPTEIADAFGVGVDDVTP